MSNNKSNNNSSSSGKAPRAKRGGCAAPALPVSFRPSSIGYAGGFREVVLVYRAQSALPGVGKVVEVRAECRGQFTGGRLRLAFCQDLAGRVAEAARERAGDGCTLTAERVLADMAAAGVGIEGEEGA